MTQSTRPAPEAPAAPRSSGHARGERPLFRGREEGVLTHGLGNVRSGSEMVQALSPGARVVKAFTIYGFENLEDNQYPSHTVKPVMMYCGNDASAKATVGALIAWSGQRCAGKRRTSAHFFTVFCPECSPTGCARAASA